MTFTPRFAPEERAEKLQEALNSIGSWLLSSVQAEDGWNEMVLDIKPLNGTVFTRITESRDTQDRLGSVGPLREDSVILAEIDKLQHAAYDEREGSWFTATVVVAAKDWPTPRFQIGAAYNRQDEPAQWAGEGPLGADELRAHLETFPRDEQQLPRWAQQRLASDARPADPKDEAAAGAEVPNPYLVAALKKITPGFRSDTGVVDVLRASLGGDVLLDISDSDLVAEKDQPVGPKSNLRYRSTQLGDNLQALCIYSSSEHLIASRQAAGSSVQPTMVREKAIKVYMDFMHNDSLQLIVVDAGTPHQTVFEKGQVGWVLSTPFNDAAQRALMAGDMQSLLTALMAPSAFLLLGARPGATSPLFLPSNSQDEEPETMLAFTSAAEVASVDVGLQVKAAPAADVLKLAESLGAKSLRINAANPSATLPIGQVQQLLALMEEAAAAREEHRGLTANQ